MRVDVPQTNQNQDVTLIGEDFIEQENLKLYAEVKKILLESQQKQN